MTLHSQAAPDHPAAARAIYLDNHATTPTDPRVAAVVLHHMTTAFGNANSVDHSFGDEAEAAVEVARTHVAALIGAMPRDVVFTSGATESINLAIVGFARACKDSASSSPVRIGVSPLEHRAVLDTCRAVEANGDAELTWFRVDGRGHVDLDSVEAALRDGLDMVCIMAANNEVGTIYPMPAIAETVLRHGGVFFTDATQGAGRIQIRTRDWGVQLVALSAHKLYGPKGIGALVVGGGVSLQPILHGGGHQRGLRSGTLNVSGIAGFGEACRLRAEEMAFDEPTIARRRDELQRRLFALIPGIVVNGDVKLRLAGNLHVSIPDVPNGAVIARLRNAVALSTGSACTSGIEEPSHVLRAMGLPTSLADGALRISLGKFNTDEEVALAADLISTAVREVRAVMSN